MPAIVLESDNYEITAKKIYYEFELNQSCTVIGWMSDDPEIEGGEGLYQRVQKVVAKADEVLKELERIDNLENVRPCGAKKMTRKRKKLPNTIGGYVAHKIFKYNRVLSDGHVRVTIWRIQ